MRLYEGFRHALIALTCAVAAASAVVAAPQAEAAQVPARVGSDRDGNCDNGEFCYYYNSGSEGSISDFADSLDNYGATQPRCYEFKGAGNGKGACIKNNAASVWNRSSGPVTVYYHRDYAEPSQTIPAGGKVNLNPTLKNENASHRFVTAPPPPPPPPPAGPSRQELIQIAESVVFGGVGAGHLEATKAQYPQFDPSTDGCSVPWPILKFPGLNWSLNNFSEIVLEACVIHDFGYRNFGGKNLRLDPTENRREAIDQAFLANAGTLCNNAFPGGRWNILATRNRNACSINAHAYSDLIRLKGESSFHRR